MKRWLQSIEQFWFSPMPAARLAILRIVSGLFVLWYLLSRYGAVQKMIASEAGIFEPVGLAAVLSKPMVPEVFMGIYCATIALNAAYILGWKYRFTGPLFAITSLFVFCYRYSWSMIYHDNIAVVLHVWVIAFAPAADALALDRQRSYDNATPHWQYGWPIRLLCAATLATYFLSGLAKVYGELAWAWVDGSAMRSQVAVDSLRKEMLGESATPLFEFLYPQTWLFLIMGLGTMVIELGAPFVLTNRRLGMIWSALTWLLHIGIYFVMGITFRYQMSGLIFMPFFEVEKFVPWLRSLFRKNTDRTAEPVPKPLNHAVVLFDGACNFCNSTVRFIAERDSTGRVQFASQQSETGRALLAEHRVSTDLSTIVLLEDGVAYQKSTAVLRIARHLNQAWPLVSAALIVPAWLRDGVYDWVARNRYRWFGKNESCPIPPVHIRQRFL